MTRLTDEQRALAGAPEHIAFARRLAARIARTRPVWEAENIEAAALFGLVTAAASFDPTRGVHFTTHASHTIRGAVYDAARAMMPKGYRRPSLTGRVVVGSLSAAASTGGSWSSRNGRPASIADTIASGEEPVGWEMEWHDEVEGLMKGVPARHRQFVRLYFTHAGLDLKAVAARMGVSESRASQVIKEVGERLRGETVRQPRPDARAKLRATLDAMAACDGDTRRAAELLGLSHRAVYDRLRDAEYRGLIRRSARGWESVEVAPDDEREPN